MVRDHLVLSVPAIGLGAILGSIKYVDRPFGRDGIGCVNFVFSRQLLLETFDHGRHKLDARSCVYCDRIFNRLIFLLVDFAR